MVRNARANEDRALLDSHAQRDTAGFTFATGGGRIRRETADSIIGAVRSVVSQSDEDRRRRGPLRIVIRAFRDTVANVTADGVPDAPLWFRVSRREGRRVAVHVPPRQSDTTRPHPLGAQVLAAQDAAGIRAAALTFADRLAHLRVSHIKRIVADTAWVAIYDPRTDIIDIPSDGSSTAGTTVWTQEVRVERRNGTWQRPKKVEGVTTPYKEGPNVGQSRIDSAVVARYRHPK